MPDKKTRYIIVVIILFSLIVFNPTKPNFRDYLSKRSGITIQELDAKYNYSRIANYIVFSVYEVTDATGKITKFIAVLRNFIQQ